MAPPASRKLEVMNLPTLLSQLFPRTIKRIRGFADWYMYYRKSHVLVHGMGRWESFCRAVEWTLKNK